MDCKARAGAGAPGAARLLLVVDNAEDALVQAEAAEALSKLMEKVHALLGVLGFIIVSGAYRPYLHLMLKACVRQSRPPLSPVSFTTQGLYG